MHARRTTIAEGTDLKHDTHFQLHTLCAVQLLLHTERDAANTFNDYEVRCSSSMQLVFRSNALFFKAQSTYSAGCKHPQCY